ncbi:hypothetical protein M5362_24090 [Streptomyces sp. Je 1-79]|uniref:hypothetical protein n=1 Tax=Streptomyces sp. Je 1-79 TaxID=2943847 RepID=UPI0021A26EE4|nr:hypothetical protein [Streptomyces sp. Je 1-79]MCT4356218.1 hypothetical protein [Streptomyces sp. Je 1-79]
MSIHVSGPRRRPTTGPRSRSERTSAAPACGSSRCRRPSAAGRTGPAPVARLCPSCVDVLRADLRRLVDAYRESDHALTPTAPRPRVRVSGTKPARGIVLDESTMALRTRMTETLASWAWLVVDEARSAKPHRCEVTALADFLCRHIEWLSAHPAAVDFDDEISQLLEYCDSVLGPGAVQRTPVGDCPQGDCSHTLEVVTAADSDRVPRQIVCRSGHVLPPQEWLRFMADAPLALAAPGARA